jgi:hypothetical protein
MKQTEIHIHNATGQRYTSKKSRDAVRLVCGESAALSCSFALEFWFTT